MIQAVLQAFDFHVRIREDLLEAKCARLDQGRTELRLNILGYLPGRTPLLDMAPESREHALRLAEARLGSPWWTWFQAGSSSPFSTSCPARATCLELNRHRRPTP